MGEYFFSIYVNLLVFLLGICIGSFINVLAYRIPRRLDFVQGRSICPACKTQLQSVDLIPLFSYLHLRGRCRFCKAKIPFRYFAVEAATGLLFLLCFWVCGLSLRLAVACAFTAILVTIFLIDLDTMEIPDGLNIALAALAILDALMEGTPTLAQRALGAVAVAAPLYLLAWLVKGSFGGGDVKLFAAVGAVLGAKRVALAAFLSILAGGVAAIYLLASGKKARKAQIPFGPAICIGSLISFLWGSEIVTWYLSLCGF